VSAISRTRSTDKRFYGVVQGVVTDVNDTEGKEGRVKVQFPWFDDQMETEWCRVRQFYAGNGYGAFFIPEVDDEVLIAFIHGDMRFPIILGGLYNGQDKPPTHRAADLDQKMIQTKGGHKLLFDDTPGKQRVSITTQGGHQADLSDADHKITLQSSGGQTVTIDDQAQSITVQTGIGSINLQTDTGQITIDPNGNITLTGVNISLEALNIGLGGTAAVHPLVWGEVLAAWLDTHIHSPAAIPPGSPVAKFTPLGALSLLSKTA
jgi:phage baseplate assembly protein V